MDKGRITGFGKDAVEWKDLEESTRKEVSKEEIHVAYEAIGVNRTEDVPHKMHLDSYVIIELPNFMGYGVYRGTDPVNMASAALCPYVGFKPVLGYDRDILEWKTDSGPKFFPISGASFESSTKEDIDTRIANHNRSVAEEMTRKKREMGQSPELRE